MSDLLSKSALRQEILDKIPQGGSRGVFLEFVDDAPTVSEKEIIRKTVERIFKRLKASSYREEVNDCDPFGDIPHYVVSLSAIKQIIKEECGINE